jgi:glutamine synthetase
VYQAGSLPRVPHSLEQAVATFRQSAVVRDAFGDAVVDHYAHAHEVEVAAHRTAVTDWERSRYFERI